MFEEFKETLRRVLLAKYSIGFIDGYETGKADGYTEGYSENYIRLYIPEKLEKRLTRVCVEELFRDGLKAACGEEKQ